MKNQGTVRLQGGATLTVNVRVWEKNGMRRIYFTNDNKRAGGQACWDMIAGEWVKVKYEFGAVAKTAIANEWRLNS
jgi:hypothetical protein